MNVRKIFSPVAVVLTSILGYGTSSVDVSRLAVKYHTINKLMDLDYFSSLNVHFAFNAYYSMDIIHGENVALSL